MMPTTLDPLNQANLFELFEAQSQTGGGKVAVDCGAAQWTYDQLYERAARLANALRRSGVQQGDAVVVSSRRSFNLLASALAVFRAGAVFVPVDPFLPKEKIRAIVSHLAPKCWMVSTEVASRLPVTRLAQIVIDADEDLPTALEASERPEVRPDSCAYIVYTSGSTGEPKGVMVSHRNLMNYLRWAAQTYFSNADASGALFHTSISFDLSLTALFTPLLVGQRVVMVPEDAPAQNIVDVLDILESGRKLALVKLTPSHLVSMSHMGDRSGKKRDVASLVVGGEALSGKVASWARDHFPGASIFNEYGPTETTIGCICYRLKDGDTLPDFVPIGKPIANTHYYVLDEDRNPVPDGASGELYIGGHGVGLGYYKSAELTRAAFIEDLFDPSARLYRTGDRVRVLPDGNLEFLDRLDRQVKIRGHRVELMEIESLLARLPEIEQAVVVDAKDGPDSSLQLVAFVKLAEGTATDAISTTLSQYLSDRLPAAAIPSRYVPVETIALTSNGKVDYHALRLLATPSDQAREGLTSPESESEKVLAEIWQTVLGIKQVDLDDNYFALGGDSIKSIRIASEAQRRGLDLSVADVQRHTSIRKLAGAIQDQLTLNVRPLSSGPFCLISEADRAKLPEGIEDAYPLNLLQEGMIYHRAFSPKSAVYHAMLGLHLKGEFNLALLKKALQELVDRHPVMRTEFDLVNYSRPLQLVHREIQVPIESFDLRDLASDQHRLAVEAWMGEEKRRGFEFNEVPLIRFAIHQFADDRFHLLFSYHHEIIDGWSEATMTSQLLNHYFSMINGVGVVMKKPTSTFRDSIVLERQALESESHKTYWTQYLKDTTLIRLPRLLSGPKADKGEREIIKKPVVISKNLSDQVKALAKELAVPVSTVLLSAHMFVLRQYSSYDDVLTHMVSNGRPEDGDGQNTLGLFVNSFTFRFPFDRGTWASTITDVLKEEQRSVAYRRYPMAELKRHQGSEPLSETLFFFTNYHVYQDLEKWEGAELVDINLYGESTFPFCAICKMNPFTHRLMMRIEYDLLQFAPELIDSMADCYLRVLREMVERPHSRFNYKSLLSPKESSQIVRRWNDRPLTEPAENTIHSLIEQLARQTPDAVALVHKSTLVTYAELNRRANRLAHHLLSEGLRVENRVGICVSSPIEMIVSMLAVLKAGGCYVPLSPEYSDERSIRIVDDAKAFCVVTDAANIRRYAASPCKKISIDQGQPIAAGRDDDPGLSIDAGNAAYSIYTSGSTGKPKGVLITHGNLARSTAARRQYYGGEGERAVLVSPFSFDSSVATIYGTLTSGGALILFRDEAQFDLGDLEAAIADDHVTGILCIPNVYGSLLDSASPRSLAGLKRVIVAGEICPKELYEQHRKLLPQVDFFNEYGPTEATVWSTVWKGGTSKLLTQVPIGEAIPGSQLYIVHHELLPQPVGVQGEIYIGGPGVARGYDNDPAATAENFVPDPFAPEPGERLYRTQDLGRYLLDGKIEFLGRKDHQVKIQGFRIEIGEVEAVLNSFEQVKRSLVHAEEDRDGQKTLVAYVVPRQPSDSLEAEIRRYVREKLPKYMHPRSYVMLHALPLTESGKIDYETLPRPGSDQGERREIARPRDGVEECIAGIWSLVLGNPDVGIHDGFFDLGGESLRAMQIVSRIRKVFDVTLPMEHLVMHGATIAEVSSYVKKSSSVGAARGRAQSVASVSQ
jgi:amino acid adenylation domain-containing protein